MAQYCVFLKVILVYYSLLQNLIHHVHSREIRNDIVRDITQSISVLILILTGVRFLVYVDLDSVFDRNVQEKQDLL